MSPRSLLPSSLWCRPSSTRLVAGLPPQTPGKAGSLLATECPGQARLTSNPGTRCLKGVGLWGVNFPCKWQSSAINGHKARLWAVLQAGSQLTGPQHPVCETEPSGGEGWRTQAGGRWAQGRPRPNTVLSHPEPLHEGPGPPSLGLTAALPVLTTRGRHRPGFHLGGTDRPLLSPRDSSAWRVSALALPRTHGGEAEV